MTYQETVEWMFGQLPMYQKVGQAAYKIDLSNTWKLTQHLGNPHTKFKSVHVAGTNGKGSTSHMIASILIEAGYKVGLYTSPHLKDFRERITINGKPVSKQFVIQFIKRNKAFFETEALSFFEMTVGMGFDYFAKQEVDIAIVEVGLGGRLDSTNIITPEVSVITNIGFDHMKFLGNTLEAIAGEKGGIIKPKVPVVISEYQKETFPVFEELARDAEAPLFLAEEIIKEDFKTDLKGNYQAKNVKAAVQAVRSLKGFNITKTHIKNGLQKVATNTGLKGRYQVLGEDPKIIADTAHNKEGLTLVMEQLKEETFDQLHIVMGVVNDKSLETILPLFPKNAKYYFCRPDIPRGLDAEILHKKATKFKLVGNTYPSVSKAYKAAQQQAKEGDLIYVGGSTFVVAEII